LRIKRTAIIASEIAEEVTNYSPINIHDVYLAARLHDIGKIACLANELYKTHTTIGSLIIEKTDLDQEVAEILLHHHETVNGKGAHGIKQVKKSALVVGLASTLDNLCYESTDENKLANATRKLLTNAKNQFSLEITEAYLRTLDRNPEIYKQLYGDEDMLNSFKNRR